MKNRGGAAVDLMVPAIGQLPSATYRLRRWPLVQNDPLQAWDAADEYLLTHLAGQFSATGGLPDRLLLINDAHGALSCSLHRQDPVNWSDSSVAHRAASENLRANGIAGPLRTLQSVDEPEGSFDLVLIRIPKTTALLEDQLIRLRPHVHQNTRIIAAAMVKHLQKSAFACFESRIGPVSASLAVHKARLLFCTPELSVPIVSSPYPDSFRDEQTGMELSNHANVFSREHLDHGARFLMSHFDTLPAADEVIDLGCGNGVLGIRCRQLQAGARIQFIDESYGAVASAEINYRRLTDDPQACHADFMVADGLECRESSSADLILCNPPFHQQHTMGERIAVSMFTGSKRCLRQKGELWVVANRHLDYRRHLDRLFGNCRLLAANRKFQILRVVKRSPDL